MSDQKRRYNLYLHPDDIETLRRAGERRASRVVALALAVLQMAPEELLDKARVEVAKRDSA